MLNFKLIEEKFRQQLEDIVIYEVQYYIQDSMVWQNLCDRFGEYLDLFYNKYDIEWKLTTFPSGTGIVRIEFDYDPPFAFEYYIDLNIYRNTRLGVDVK